MKTNDEPKVPEVIYRRGLRRPRPEGAIVGEVPEGFECVDPVGEIPPEPRRLPVRWGR